MHQGKIKNKFLLRLKSDNIEKLDKIFRHLIVEKRFDALLLTPIVFKKDNKAIYRVKMSIASLVAFKNHLDRLVSYDFFEVFEYKEW